MPQTRKRRGRPFSDDGALRVDEESRAAGRAECFTKSVIFWFGAGLGQLTCSKPTLPYTASKLAKMTKQLGVLMRLMKPRNNYRDAVLHFGVVPPTQATVSSLYPEFVRLLLPLSGWLCRIRSFSGRVNSSQPDLDSLPARTVRVERRVPPILRYVLLRWASPWRCELPPSYPRKSLFC